MKLLLAATNLSDFTEAFSYFNLSIDNTRSYIHQVKINQHEVTLIETGVGVFQTTYKLTKTMNERFHLALKLSTGNAYNETLVCGTVVNIINEKPGDYGVTSNGAWRDIYDLGLLSRESSPHVRGGLVNMTNAYMNIFMPYKKVVGISVNHYGDETQKEIRQQKYKADVETGDGIGASYTFLYEKQSFYHLCAIEKNLVSGEENFNLATQKLNESLIDILQKL